MRRHWDMQEYFWGIPLVYVMGAIAVGVTLPRLESRFAPELLSPVTMRPSLSCRRSLPG